MNNNLGKFLGLAISCMLLLASCAMTTPTKIWKDPYYVGGTFKKALVIVVAKHPSIRELVENEFVLKLQGQGADAVASHMVLATDKKVDRKFILSTAQKLGIDAVLVTRVIEAKEKDDVYYETASPYRVPIATLNAKLHEEYMQKHGKVHPSAVIARFKEIILETKAYEVVSDKAVWSLESDTRVQDTFSKLLSSYLDVVVKRLTVDKLI